MNETIEQQIEAFKQRVEVDGLEFCTELFEYATTRLMAHKYAYYVNASLFVDDYSYDMEERDWYVMGRALGLLKEDETSPCIDFDYSHLFAQAGIDLAGSLKPNKDLTNKLRSQLSNSAGE